MENKPKVGIVILNWNTKKETSKAIAFALRTEYENFRVALVDNGSTDGSVDYLKDKFHNKITILENSENLGYSGGLNTGINYFAKDDYNFILVLNSDAYIAPGSVSALVEVAESNNDIGFVTGKVYYYNQPKRLQIIGRKKNWLTIVGEDVGSGELDKGQYDSITEFDFIDDVFMLIKSDTIKKVGGYDENLFIQWEEADLITRGRNEGYTAVYTPHAKVWHEVSLSTGGTESSIRNYYTQKNRIIFLNKHHTQLMFLLFMVYYIFLLLPKYIINHLIKRRYESALSSARGCLSGLIYVMCH